VVFAGMVLFWFPGFYPNNYHRQFISEFSKVDMPVYLLNLQGAAKETTMGELLPFAFGLEEGKKFLM
jgi:cytidine deaminase